MKQNIWYVEVIVFSNNTIEIFYYKKVAKFMTKYFNVFMYIVFYIEVAKFMKKHISYVFIILNEI